MSMNTAISNFLPDPYVYRLGYIILYLPLLSIVPELTIDGEVLFAKDRFHMSILGVKEYNDELSKKLKVTPEEAGNKILEESKKILEDNPINFIRFKDDIRLVRETDKKTVVVMCEATGIDSFFNKLRNVLEIELPTQPVHATIYTRKDGRGIGMTSEKELSDFTRSLTNSETVIVKKALDWDKLNI